MEILLDNLKNLKSYKDTLEALKKESAKVGAFGTIEGFTSIISYALSFNYNEIILLTSDEIRAKKINEDLNFLGKKASYYPAKDIFLYERDYRSMDNIKNRINALKEISLNKEKILVTTFNGLKDKITSPDIFKNNFLAISIGATFDLNELGKIFYKMGYERVFQVESMGEYCIRGGIVDIYTPDGPMRLEFFDNEVDSIRSFEIESQRSIENLENILISPAKEIIIPDEERKKVAEKIEKSLKKTRLKGRDLERLKEKFNLYIERLGGDFQVNNWDLLLPFIDEKYLSSIFDYFSKPLIIIEDPRKILERDNSDLRTYLENLKELILNGEALKEHENVSFKSQALIEKLNEDKVLTLNTLLNPPSDFTPKDIVNFKLKSIVNYRGRLKIFKEDINSYLYKGYKILLMAGSEKRAQRLLITLKELDLKGRINKEIKSISSGEIVISTNNLSQGIEIVDSKLIILNQGDIYEQNIKRKKRKKSDIKLSDLKIGDYVVHETHGIAQYVGNNIMEIQGIKRDYLTLQYSGGDRVFIPIESLDIIHKYIGSEGVRPKLNKLNSTDWQKQKSKAKKAVEEMADYLIELYANRENSKGYQYSPDTEWQREFENSFIYEETEGQLRASQEIKDDMEKQKPMDRLLCADVGYGKTEVAIRAAFKAVMDSKQVAFLVPTTILAQQHYNTLVERFRDFPIKIAMLSRFRSLKEQKEDIKDLKNGFVDIVIGTHRLLSKDIKFKDLGLLIVDEEQRFGVKHKESLKLLKENVDTLTLTATPIPRTLQMSMIGIRDMSVIDEPPEERFPTQTYVLEYNDMMIREAILKEIERDGQVYFVYNRVSNMENKLAELRKLVPEASFAMANGQMKDKVLEETMMSFLNHEVDVLLCSTIIETGMDVQNANTMIVTEANRLGLSQLYQLRGRIGRSNRLSYAYFTYDKRISMSEIAEKRLKSIKEFTEFGSGYKIAMRDLEIRGSGSILGEKQSGHIETIGYDLYIKYLQDAIKKKKGLESEEEVETTIDIKIDSYIPKTYINNEEITIEIYKKIAGISNNEDYRDLLDELFDRFGNIPREVSNLMDISLIRQTAKKLGIISIVEINKAYEISFIKEKLTLPLINEIRFTFKDLDFNLRGLPKIRVRNLKNPLEDIKSILAIIGSHKY